MRSTEELTALKAEVETLNEKLAELTEEELAQVTGGCVGGILGISDFGGAVSHVTHAPVAFGELDPKELDLSE